MLNKYLRLNSIASLAALFAMMPALKGKEADLNVTRATLEKWIEVEKQIGDSDSEWKEENKTIHDIIDVLESEISILEEKLNTSKEEISQADAKRAELGAKREKLKKASGAIQNVIENLEIKVHQLYPLFPDPLKTTIDPLYNRTPKPGKPTHLSLSARMQNVVGILTQVDKFNGGVFLDNSGLHKLDNGKTVKIKTLYLGLGYAYFTDSAGTYAGYGVPGEEGWVWTEKADLAPMIADAIEVYEDPQRADYVELPVSLK